MTSVRELAEESESIGKAHNQQAEWLPAAGSLMAAGLQWRSLREMRRAEQCMRAAALALAHAANDFAVADSRSRRETAR